MVCSEEDKLEINSKYERYQEISLIKSLKPINCQSCQVPKIFRTSHCMFCDYCVTKYECHSYVLNTCIGSRNILIYMLFMLAYTIYHLLCFAEVRHYARDGKFTVPGAKSFYYIFYAWISLFSGKELVWPIVSICINKTLDERCSSKQSHWFGTGRNRAELCNPFDKGIVKNISEAFISTCSYSGLSRKSSTLDMSIDEEKGLKESWDDLLDTRIQTEPLNWSKTFICLLFEVECPARSEMIKKIENRKSKFRGRGDKDRKGRTGEGIDVSYSSEESGDSDSSNDSDPGHGGECKDCKE